MEKIQYINTIDEYNKCFGVETLNPLATVIDFSKNCGVIEGKISLNFYTVFLKDVKCGDMVYGRGTYDYQEGTLVFLAPGQVYGIVKPKNNQQLLKGKGYALCFHKDLLRGTELGKNIEKYNFFSYNINEALHISQRERQIILDCIGNIQVELEHSIDKHSKILIVRNIELFLDYCMRFYDRQFITRENLCKDSMYKFEKLLNDYFSSDKPSIIGLPSVSWCAEQMHLSPNYFGDIVKRELGISAKEYINNKMVDVAKSMLFDYRYNISEVAYNLGFKYPQHFTRMFKRATGKTPAEYRETIEN